MWTDADRSRYRRAGIACRAKKVKGRKAHVLVDTEGLPLCAAVHSAAIQDRESAALVFDRIRQRFNWLELVWPDGGYNAREVRTRRRRAASSAGGDCQAPRRQFRICRPAVSLGCRRDLFVVRPKPPPG
ncbi:transposase [Rhodopila sp.]|uniref:transposase n=1 Tax=Rhodopila sp. TaxID=2480087 RepID=UPI0038CFE0B1